MGARREQPGKNTGKDGTAQISRISMTTRQRGSFCEGEISSREKRLPHEASGGTTKVSFAGIGVQHLRLNSFLSSPLAAPPHYFYRSHDTWT
jgi:hypothetical protein